MASIASVVRGVFRGFSGPERGEWHSLLFMTNPVPMYVCDTEGTVFFDVNDAALRQYGYERDEFLALRPTDIRPPEEVPKLLFALALVTDGVTARGTWRHRRRDGSIFPVNVVTQPVEYRNHRALLVVAHDLSEQVRRGEEARKSARLLQGVLDEMSAVVFVKDRDGRIILVNRAWERLIGRSRVEAVGKTTHEIFGKATADAFRQHDEEALKSSDPLTTEVMLPYGGEAHAFMTSRSVLRGYNGEPEALVGLAVDITERKKAEAERARLARAMAQVAEAITVTDPDGKIVYVNPAFEELSGYSLAEAMGQTPRLVRSGQQDAEFYADLWSVLKRGEVWSGHFTNRRKDGRLYETEATIAPVFRSDGTLVNYVSVQRDLTIERSLRDQLFQAQKMEAVGRLAAGVAHDFNNILGVIIGYGERLQRDLKDCDVALQGRMAQIMKAAERATTLTRQLLSFSRKEARPEVLDLNVVVDDMGKMLRRLIGEDVQLVTRLSVKVGHVSADPGQIEQVLLNLAVNARDAMPQGGKLTIETVNVQIAEPEDAPDASVPAGRYVMLRVSDTGMGMDTPTKARVFEPFFTTKGAGKGTGLGLATVYAIVTGSRGQIRVDSEPGRGATFRIYFPLTDALPTRRHAMADAPAPCGTETILVAEDEENMREVIRATLEEHGYRVIAARSGTSAMEALEGCEECPQLVLADVVMPGISGCELVRMTQQSFPGLKAIYMSGHTDDALAAYGTAGSPFLRKPFSAETLLRSVRRELDRDAAAVN